MSMLNMSARTLGSLAIAALVAVGAANATTPVPGFGAKTADDCLKQAIDVAQRAELKKWSDAEIDRVEELLNQMEGHCDARQFIQAGDVLKAISALIEAKQ